MQVTTQVVGVGGCQLRCPRGTSNLQRTLQRQKLGRSQRLRTCSVGLTESVRASGDQGERGNAVS